ncbi:hypothetical protein LTR56_009937 [Elasticomyces elasticus]|nr:hypothetical protein LTR56_009937 [Elasticomyces elasticus]KAK3656215.1 hypothetical protein LTR22_009923 [Elasticomyces elasticus]KAK4933725.1 hypothetical protein LTR49_000190 [Elasticomyces elasticus]KAK5761585.1 hypothetical protein LTS12_008189 [Elasticomyces elasticus]
MTDDSDFRHQQGLRHLLTQVDFEQIRIQNYVDGLERDSSGMRPTVMLYPFSRQTLIVTSSLSSGTENMMATARSGIQQRLASAMLTSRAICPTMLSEDHLAYTVFPETVTAHARNNMKLIHMSALVVLH